MMFSTLLVPVDGSPSAEAALPTARTLATAFDAEVRLLRVVRRPAAPLDGHAAELAEAAAYLDALACVLTASGIRVQTRVRSGDVVAAILAEIEEQGVDLVVMATRGRTGIVRTVLGSVANAVLARSPVPVVLLRADTRPIRRISRLLVAVDDSAASALALETATRVAQATSAHLTLLEVVAPIPAWMYTAGAASDFVPYVDPDWETIPLEEARRSVDQLVEQVHARGMFAHGRALRGDVPRTIARVADELAADLIVMGTRAHTGAARAVLGSVADAVVRSAGAPVLLLRGYEAEADGGGDRQPVGAGIRT